MSEKEEKEKKQRVNLLVNPKTLAQWDDLAKLTGCNRTSTIHNAMIIYKLFITNQLNGDKTESIKEQIEQIKLLIEGLHQRERYLEKDEKAIEERIREASTKDILDFDIISQHLLTLLGQWGALVEDTIFAHFHAKGLTYPNWVIWTVLKKLKEMKKVKVVNGEWSLYE